MRFKGFKGPITGKHVLIGMIAFFAVTIAVNATFITLAVRTFSGEEVERSYVQGLAFNQVLEERRAQAARGWEAAVDIDADRVIVSVSDPEGGPVGGLELAGALRHPADTSRDVILDFVERETGVYIAEPGAVPPGAWTLAAEGENGPAFSLRRRMFVENAAE
ncbi:ferredoxin [Marinicauda salina]|uniref:Ferredoxin n=1 Tax=Marinicauda salina TaxID=2135793 RepID=A0A2U2BWT6_9PROT|nr:FixH family protein [Marinicauda salina]PWE18483.1 ferredoxin [Marinicauda salina]